MNRREFLKFAGAAGALPLFNIGCAGFGRRTSSEIANAHQNHGHRKGWEIV